VAVTGLGIGTSMTYNPVSGAGVTQPATSGELTQVTMPNLGWLRWAYRSFTYPGSHSLREVQYRYLAKSGSSGETSYSFAHDDSGSSQVHAWTTLGDPTGSGKYWSFFTDTSQWTAGLVSTFEDRLTPSGTAVRRRAYTWTQGPAGDPYISAVLVTADPGTAYQKQSKTTQVVDGYGNVTQTQLYDYGSLITPARTYTNTYLSASGYPSRYIRNRLLTSTVSDGTNTTTLVSNTFDSYSYPWVVGITTVTGAREHDLTYDGTVTTRGNVTSSVHLGVTNLIAYDTTGTVVGTYDALGRTVSAAYSATTNNAAPDALTPNVNSNLSTSYTYTSFLGLASVTGPNQANSHIAYDSYGRPTSSTSPHGAVTTYAYTYNPTTVTATTGTRVVKTTLDGLGRTIKVETGDTSAVQSVVETVYDSCACSPLGKVKQVSLPHAPGATVYWTTYAYDALGRTVTVTSADGSVTSYLYQGNCTTITDPAGKWKAYTSDAMGNLTLVSEPAPGGGTHQTTYTYNLLNKLTGVSMPRGSVTQTRTFNYDLTTGRLMSATNPENGTVSYTYRADGSLASKTDAKNQQTTYTYDSYGRLTQAAGYSYYYDSNPLDASYPPGYGWGRLAAVAWTSTIQPRITNRT
jgi:YD repeat-containing protein